MVKGAKISRADLANFLCSLPQLATKYRDIAPINPLGGTGQNSVVLLAKDGNKPVVLKFDGPWSDTYRRSAFQREYHLLVLLKGKREVIQLRGELERIELSIPSGGGVNLPYILAYFPLELAKTDLEAIIYSGAQLKILQQLLLFRAAVRSVRRLHSNKICHRDLKPSNLLVFKTDSVKVADLGSAREIGEGAKGILDKYDFCRGDIRYTAPELLCVARECDQGFLDGDFYSLGAILFEMLTGKVFGDFVYSFEYLRRLGDTFRMMPALSREDMFSELLPSIISSHPMPRLSDITKKIPASVSPRLENLYLKLVEPDCEKRLNNFEELFAQLDIMVRILRHEEKSKHTF